jgi:hypothetical protein
MEASEAGERPVYAIFPKIRCGRIVSRDEPVNGCNGSAAMGAVTKVRWDQARYQAESFPAADPDALPDRRRCSPP